MRRNGKERGEERRKLDYEMLGGSILENELESRVLRSDLLTSS